MKNVFDFFLVLRGRDKEQLRTRLRRLPKEKVYELDILGIVVEKVVQKQDQVIQNYLDRSLCEYRLHNTEPGFIRRSDFHCEWWQLIYGVAEGDDLMEKELNLLLERVIIGTTKGLDIGGIITYSSQISNNSYSWKTSGFRGKEVPVPIKVEEVEYFHQPNRLLHYLDWLKNRNPESKADYTVMKLRYGLKVSTPY